MSFRYKSYTTGFGETTKLGVNNILKTETLRGESRTLLITPKVKQFGAEYFGCTTLSGVELENEGGSGSMGSHWERVLLFNEYMTSSDFRYPSVSGFTLALMADTGWYDVDSSLAE